MYKELNCLWDREVPEYRMKMKKHAAWTKLTQLVQEYDPNATRVHVLRKIDSLRACVRREYKRVQDSRRQASCEEELYTPNLWYFDLMSFVFKDYDATAKPLLDHTTSVESEQEEEEDDDEPIQEVNHDSYDSEPYPADTTEYNIPMNVVEVNDRPSSSKKQSPAEDPFKTKRCKASTEVDDEYDAIGINVAAKLRSLPSNMRILAEKLVNDVLFQAQINGLNSSTRIVTPDPFKQENVCAPP